MLSRLSRFVLTLIALVATLLAQSSALSQTDEKKLDAVKEYKALVKKFKDPKQVIEAVYTLKLNECPEAAAELVRLFDHADPTVKATAINVLALYKDEATWKPYLDEITNLKQSSARRPLLVEAMGKAKLKAALFAFKEILEKDKKVDAITRYQIARALPEIGEKDVKDQLAQLLQDSEWTVRLAAADAVAALSVKGLGKELVALFSDSLWEVQSAAVKAVAKVRPEEAIDPLIELMRKGGRLKEETADALFSITTLDFGMDPDTWVKRMKPLREINWRIPSDEELAKKAISRERTDALYGKTKDKGPGFVGIPTSSRNVLFIIDVSGSMEELVVEHEKFTTGYDDWRKFTIVRTELLRTIDSLKEDTNFNIIAFATDLHAWKHFLVQANVAQKEGAKSWVRGLKPLGGSEAQEMAEGGLVNAANVGAGKTNTYKSLMAMFDYDPDKQPIAPIGPTTGKPVLINKETKLDTVYFLSDGRPSTGKYVDTNEIRREVRERNQLYKIMLHTIAIGEFQKDFMKNLAAENGGVFVDLGK